MTGTGRYYVDRHWHRWATYDGAWLQPSKVAAGPFDTQAEAQAATDHLNQPAPATAPAPRQTSLFDDHRETA